MRRGLARRTVIGATAIVTASVVAFTGGGIAVAGGTTGVDPAAPTVSAGSSEVLPGAPGVAADRVPGGPVDPSSSGPGGSSLPERAASPPSDPASSEPGDPPSSGPGDPRSPGPADPPSSEPAGPSSSSEPADSSSGAPADPPAGDPAGSPVDDPAASDPADGPSASGPADDSTASDPAASDPAASDPAASDPADVPAEDPAAPPAEEPADEQPDPSARPADQSTAKPGAPTAAERYGWGDPLPASDEFDYDGPPDPQKWKHAGECWPGHDGNGGRCASRSTVDGEKLVQTGLADGDSAWIGSTFNQQYGRWEARVRSEGTGPDNGRQYHPLLIIWPQSDQWPEDGEYDFLENGAPGEQCAEAFIHYPHGRGSIQQEFVRESDCGAPLTEWHNVAIEWTPDHIKGFIDGAEWFSFSGGAQGNRRNIQDMPSGHLTIQLDNFFGGDMQPATYEVDWVRIYDLDS